MSKLTQFARFVGKYAGEIRAVTGLFSGILNMLPVNPADRSDFTRAIDGLNAAADRIEESLPGILDGGISRDELKIIARELLLEMLPDILAGATETVTRGNVKAVTPAPMPPVETSPPAAPARPARVRNRKKAAKLPTADQSALTGEGG